MTTKEFRKLCSHPDEQTTELSWLMNHLLLASLPIVLYMGLELSLADEVSYKKLIQGNRAILLEREEVPYSPPSKSEIADVRKEFGRDVEFAKPSHVYEYALMLLSPEGKVMRKLWSKKYQEYDKLLGGETGFRILDVLYLDEVSYVVYKEDGWTVADSVSMRDGETKREGIWPGSILCEDRSGSGLIVRSAALSMQGEKKFPCVELKYSNGHKSEWVRDDEKWIEQKTRSREEVDVHIKDNHGCTPLMLAAQGGTFEEVKDLLDRGAKVNERDNEGWTALMYAAEWDNPEIVQLLIDKGADVNVDADETTALHLALKGNRQRVANVLKKAGAKEHPDPRRKAE